MFQSTAALFHLQDLFLLPPHWTCNAERDASDFDAAASTGSAWGSATLLAACQIAPPHIPAPPFPLSMKASDTPHDNITNKAWQKERLVDDDRGSGAEVRAADREGKVNCIIRYLDLLGLLLKGPFTQNGIKNVRGFVFVLSWLL